MKEASEIKCPECGQWNLYTARVDDKCSGCGNLLEPERYRQAEERRIEDSKGNFMVINESDENIVQIGKMFVNAMRWGSYLGAVLFFFVAAAMLVVFGLIFI